MDANTQIANDLHLLTAPIRFLFRCVLALIFLLLAPLLYSTIPFACIAADPNSDFSMLALAYLALGPFASAFWLMMVGVLPDVHRAHKEGRVFEANHLKGFRSDVRRILRIAGRGGSFSSLSLSHAA